MRARSGGGGGIFGRANSDGGGRRRGAAVVNGESPRPDTHRYARPRGPTQHDDCSTEELLAELALVAEAGGRAHQPSRWCSAERSGRRTRCSSARQHPRNRAPVPRGGEAVDEVQVRLEVVAAGRADGGAQAQRLLAVRCTAPRWRAGTAELLARYLSLKRITVTDLNFNFLFFFSSVGCVAFVQISLDLIPI